jgi:hypothetical protein
LPQVRIVRIGADDDLKSESLLGRGDEVQQELTHMEAAIKELGSHLHNELLTLANRGFGPAASSERLHFLRGLHRLLLPLLSLLTLLSRIYRLLLALCLDLITHVGFYSQSGPGPPIRQGRHVLILNSVLVS